MRKVRHVLGAIAVAAVLAWALAGCGGGEALLAYTGGGLPPGDPDLGGVVVASADGTVSAAQTSGPDLPEGVEPIADAEVSLLRGQAVVGRTTTGEGGYFRFEHPLTGRYTLVVEPPAWRDDLQREQRIVNHTRGQQTFVTVELPRAQQAPGPPEHAQ